MYKFIVAIMLVCMPLSSFGSIQAEVNSDEWTAFDAELEQEFTQEFKQIKAADSKVDDLVDLYKRRNWGDKDIYLQILFFDNIDYSRTSLAVSQQLLQIPEINCRNKLYIKVLGYGATSAHSVEEIRKHQAEFNQDLLDCDLDNASDAIFLQTRILINLLVQEDLFNEGAVEIRNLTKNENLAHAGLFAKTYLYFTSSIQVTSICFDQWQVRLKDNNTATTDCPSHQEAFDELVKLVPKMEGSKNLYLREYVMPWMHNRYSELLKVSRKHRAHEYAVSIVTREL